MFRIFSLSLCALGTAVLAASLPPITHADNCLSCRRAAVSVQVSHAAVQAQVVTPVIATPVVTTLVIPQAVRVEAIRDSYYSGAAAYRDALVADAVAWRAYQAAQGAAAQKAAAGPAPSQASKSAPTAPTAVPDKLAGIFSTRCAACHSNGKNKVDFGDLATTPAETRTRIFYYVMAGHMPIRPDGTADPLPDEELQPIADWVGAAIAPNKVSKRGI